MSKTNFFEVQGRSKMDSFSGKLMKFEDLRDRPYWGIMCNSAAGGSLFNRMAVKEARTKAGLVRKIRAERKRTRCRIWWH
jgi:hypothetical protein